MSAESIGELERRAGESRSKLEHSLGELRRRMKPLGLADEALGFAGARDPERLRATVRQWARDYPLPLLMIGAGLAWLAWDLNAGRRLPVPSSQTPQRASAVLPTTVVHADVVLTEERDHGTHAHRR